MRTTAFTFIILFAIGEACLFADDIGSRMVELDARKKYAEALALCLEEGAGSPAALYLAGDYFFHGREGVERDAAKGKAYYRKALDAFRPVVESGDIGPEERYRLARCIEFGLGEAADAKEWYAAAAEGGHTNAMRRCLAYWEAGGGLDDIPEHFEKIPEIWTSEMKAKHGAKLYERPESREKGLSILKEAAQEGSPFALARLSALFYLGEGGVRQDYGMALKLMKAAVAKGFPEDQLPIEEAEAACKRAQATAKEPPPGIRPGDGYPGRLDTYDVTPDLKKHLDRFNLTAGWFRRDPLAEGMLDPRQAKDLLANELPYLLFTPRGGQKPVPMVVYFGGTGEHGTNLVEQFRQTTVFATITSPAFQKKHPCHLFAPMVPKGTYLRCDKAWSPPMADLVCDALYAVVREANNPPVDTNRLYLTGLSYGGSAAYTFPFGYPGRFAASLPVAGYVTEHAVPDEKPGNFWLLCNEHEYASESMQQTLAAITRIIAERGGEHRASTFPDKGHNAWDKAWREEAVWEWMFSKTADGSPADQPTGPARPVAPHKRPAAFLEGAICTAAKPGRDGGTGPERAADGLEATCYVSAEPFKRGDWWRIDFATPVSGRISVKSGSRDGSGRAASARVETSSDGQAWTRAGRFSHDDGECRFVPNSPIKHLRVVSGSQTGETLILREVMVEE